MEEDINYASCPTYVSVWLVLTGWRATFDVGLIFDESMEDKLKPCSPPFSEPLEIDRVYEDPVDVPSEIQVRWKDSIHFPVCLDYSGVWEDLHQTG